MVLSAATQRLTVEYGGFVLDETNGIKLQANKRRYELYETHKEGFFSVDFVLRLTSPTGVEATDDLAMKNLINATKVALTKRRQKLLVKLNGNVINGNGSGWDPAGSVKTAFLIEAELKQGQGPDTARAVTYTFQVRCQLPAESTERRRDSSVQVVSGVNGFAICTMQGVWTASASKTAYEQYVDQGELWFSESLPDPTSGREWTPISSDPVYDDENATIRVTRVFWEVLTGLRECRVEVVSGANGAKAVTISGLYAPTPLSTPAKTAIQNYTAGISAIVASVLAAEGGASSFESVSVPKFTGYDTTGQLYRFSHTYTQIVYPQGFQTDDPNVTLYTLDVAVQRSFERNTNTNSIQVERLRRAFASYTAVIDKASSGGTDPHTLWATKLRAYVVNAVSTKLGTFSVIVEDERVRVGLDGNTISAQLDMLVRGGNVLSLTMREKITRTPSLQPRPMADGVAHSYWPYRIPPSKILEREAAIEYVSGSTPPVIWEKGVEGSGHKFVDTKYTAEESLDMQDRGDVPPAPGWLARPVVQGFFPGSQGEREGLATVIYARQEEWLWIARWASQKALPGIA